MEEKVSNKLRNLISLDNMPDIIFDIEDYNNVMMDIAKECNKVSSSLSKKELEYYGKHKDSVVKLVSIKKGLI